MRNNREEAGVEGPELEWEVWRPGFFRIEVYTYSARIGKTYFRLKPWIFANTMGLRGMGDGSG